MTDDATLMAYVDCASQLADLPLPGTTRDTVAGQLRILFAMSTLFVDIELAADVDPITLLRL